MEYIYAALILHETESEINESNLTAVLEAAGEDVIASRVKAIVAALEGVDFAATNTQTAAGDGAVEELLEGETDAGADEELSRAETDIGADSTRSSIAQDGTDEPSSDDTATGEPDTDDTGA